MLNKNKKSTIIPVSPAILLIIIIIGALVATLSITTATAVLAYLGL